MTNRQRKMRRRVNLQAAAMTNEPILLEAEQPVEFVAAAGEGKLPTFKMTAYTGGKMRPRGFSTPVVVDLARTTVASGDRPFLFNHDPTQIVGHGQITVEKNAIRAEGTMSGVGPAAENVRASALNGFPWKSSIGADVGKLDFIEAGKSVDVNGRTHAGPVYVARDNVVYESSFVSLAGDNRSSATVAASLGDPAMNEFEKWLTAKGFELAKLTDDQKTALKAAFDAEQTPPAAPPAKPKVEASNDDPPEEDPIKTLRAEQAAEVARVKGIRKLCAKAEYEGVTIKTSAGESDLEAHAIAEGWTADATELYALRAKRPAPAVHGRSHDTDATLQALQGAVMVRAGLALDAKHWATQQAVAIGMPSWIRMGLNAEARQKAMEAAHRFSGMSMFDMCREALRLDGKEITANRTEVIQAAFSSSALNAIWTTSVNARLLATYLEYPDTTTAWTSEVDRNDFKQNDVIQLAKGGSLDKLARGNSATHYNRSDRSENYKVARYARQFVVDEQDVIDDRLNALQDMPKEMGLAAARLRPDIVYSILFANAALNADSVALFHSTHANTDSSAGLAASTLKTGMVKVAIQTDNGVNLNLRASHLVVPQTLYFTGKELVNSSQIVIAGTSGSVTERGNTNTIAGENLTVVSDSRLDNGVTDPRTGTVYSGDTNDWFLVSNMGNTIEIGYRAGTGRAPQVRSFILDRGQWGMGWDVCHDIGGQVLDYRPFYRGQG
jgi:hypothetical protein